MKVSAQEVKDILDAMEVELKKKLSEKPTWGVKQIEAIVAEAKTTTIVEFIDKQG